METPATAPLTPVAQYILQARSTGMTTEQITAALRQAGWPEADIAAAFAPILAADVAKLPPNVAPPKPTSLVMVFFAVFFSSLIIAGLVGGTWWLLNSESQIDHPAAASATAKP